MLYRRIFFRFPSTGLPAKSPRRLSLEVRVVTTNDIKAARFRVCKHVRLQLYSESGTGAQSTYAEL